MEIYLTALIKSKSGAADEMKGYLLELLDASTQEAACIQYELHQSSEESTQFIFHETWASQKGLDLHNQQPHVQKFSAAAGPIMEGPVAIIKTIKIA